MKLPFPQLLPVIAVALVSAACLPDGAPPLTPAETPPPSCGNGRCEPGQGEQCLNCPGDCACCAAIDAQGQVPTGQDRAAAVGSPDGKSVELDALSDLQLALGREVFDRPGAPDLQLHGAVEGGSAAPTAGGCGSSAARAGAFEVTVSLDGDQWHPLGFWSQATGAAAFDLACARVSRVRLVRLRATSGARARLDAVSAFTEATGRQPSCDPRGFAADGGTQ